jgi:hypothetical protein
MARRDSNRHDEAWSERVSSPDHAVRVSAVKIFTKEKEGCTKRAKKPGEIRTR